MRSREHLQLGSVPCCTLPRQRLLSRTAFSRAQLYISLNTRAMRHSIDGTMSDVTRSQYSRCVVLIDHYSHVAAVDSIAWYIPSFPFSKRRKCNVHLVEDHGLMHSISPFLMTAPASPTRRKSALEMGSLGQVPGCSTMPAIVPCRQPS